LQTLNVRNDAFQASPPRQVPASAGPVPACGPYPVAVLTKLSAVAAILLVAGCGTSRTAGPDAPPPTPDGPTRDQVLMANGLCASAIGLDRELADARQVLTSTPDDFPFSDAETYLSFAGSDISSLVATLEELPVSGVEAADRYAASLAAEIARVLPEIERLAGDTWDAYSMSEQDRIDRVTRIVEQLETIDPEGPDLRTLVRETPEFEEFYELAPNCEPLDPPPPSSTPPPPPNKSPEEAEDGTDLGACADGDCEVAITGATTVTVGEYALDVSVAGGEVTIVEDFAGGGTGTSTMGGVGAVTSVGTSGGTTVTMTVNGLHGDTAVLRFATN
jgi:hypothetical protein